MKQSSLGLSNTVKRTRKREFLDAMELVFLTNRLDLSALTIAAIYKQRWQVELTLPLFRVVLSPMVTRLFYAVPRTSVARTASG